MSAAAGAATAHVVGAGLAGLSAAVRIAEAGGRVVLYDGAKAAGGRCRSYHDPALDLTIDNGNHLLLSGNRAALDFVELVGGGAALEGPDEAAFPFADLRTGERWTLRPNAGRLPWWIAAPSRRVPGTRTRDYLAPLAILRARPETPIGRAMRCSGPLWERLWHPVLLAALNTDPASAACGLAAPVLRESLGAGGRSCRPIVATGGLSAAFVEPALRYLRARGAEIRLGSRLKGIEAEGSAVTALRFADERADVGGDDSVILALPSWSAAEILPGLAVPEEHRSIVNAHYRMIPPEGLPPVLGLVGGVAEWVFAYPDRISVTISGADRLLDSPREELASAIWRDVAAAARLDPTDMPAWQVVKERRATFAATPAILGRRPGSRTRYHNLGLAGDWTDTGLPATIEGAITIRQDGGILVAARLMLRVA